MARSWRRSRFDQPDEDPLGPLANLVDVVLVFACGLIAALVARTDLLEQLSERTPVPVERGRELPQMPAQADGGGQGMEAVGRVYRDPDTGKLLLIGD